MKTAKKMLIGLGLVLGGCASNGVSYDVRSMLKEKHGCIGAATTPYLDISDIEKDIATSQARSDYRDNCLSGYAHYPASSIPGIHTNYDSKLNVVVAYRK